MFTIFTRKNIPTIDSEIDRLIAEMKEMKVESQEYANAIENLSWLTEARAQKGPFQIDMNTVVVVIASFAEMLLLMNHEKLNIVTTKAFNRMTKPRI